MVTQDNVQRLNELLTELKTLFPDTVTLVKLTITAEFTKIVTRSRHAEDLKKKNVTIRNVKGDWIGKLR
jgi:hypothetical protein